jgi:hypothetical protein
MWTSRLRGGKPVEHDRALPPFRKGPILLVGEPLDFLLGHRFDALPVGLVLAARDHCGNLFS